MCLFQSCLRYKNRPVLTASVSAGRFRFNRIKATLECNKAFIKLD